MTGNQGRDKLSSNQTSPMDATPPDLSGHGAARVATHLQRGLQ